MSYKKIRKAILFKQMGKKIYHLNHVLKLVQHQGQNPANLLLA